MPEQTFEERIIEIKKNLGSWMPNPALQVELEEGLDELTKMYSSLQVDLINEIYSRQMYGEALDYICNLHGIRHEEITDYFSERLLIR